MARNVTKLTQRLDDESLHSDLTTCIELDLESQSQIEQACSILETQLFQTLETNNASPPKKFTFDLVFIATGWLHDTQFFPEKTWKSLDAMNLHKAYQINAVGPMMFLKRLFESLDLTHPTLIGVLSARVGSISDNRMGGWHSYRASKAALNMLIKNFAIELTRKRKPICLVGLQPGTTDSALSQPFQKLLSPDQLQTPDFTAQKLLAMMQQLTLNDSGKLYDFKGCQFEP